ncbi:MAG: DUF5943 domain-containing protein [Alphaproteobacteria bacterium]|jgi:predicted hydrocarbon binding protein|nr:DUF5943 domain-containing protein [Alphaproteobacteria bacterium]MDP6515126.1 DUF5943 domain-containing protein [Alphaproteobacteria bacterium]|tara:strand:- start:1144 stop:1677 length:534 start_codon:yes stop_codon:yes gene_type:complete
MAAPEVAIDVDPRTGVWRSDGMEMLYVPRHFLINNHRAMEEALGIERYARLLHDPGYRSAQQWCAAEAASKAIAGEDVFRHYMLRLSQRGWGQFTVLDLSAAIPSARVRVDHSAFVYGYGGGAGRPVCAMFAGWLVGALSWVAGEGGAASALRAREVACAANGADHCAFEVVADTAR